MPRKKKTEEPVITETTEIKKDNTEKIIVNTKETYLFQITPLTENVKLYKYPTTKTPQGKMKRGQICNVTCEINYTPVKMYKLDTGYYVVADQNIKKI